MKATSILVLSAVVALGTSACGNGEVDTKETETATAVAVEMPKPSFKPESGFDGTVSKPGSPFTVSYRVVGTPIVGSPTIVDLRVSTTLGQQPVKVSYRISDAASMMFHEAQPAEVEIAPAADDDFIAQQVTVIPQREGRLYLNVGTSVETEDGSVASVIAIPIQVGAGGRMLEQQGEVQLDENGEAIRVLTPE